MMLTQAASLFDTRPPAISLALSLFGAVTKAMENSSKVRPDAMVDTEKRRDVPKLRKGRRMLGINATESTVIYLVRYIKSGFCPDMRTFKNKLKLRRTQASNVPYTCCYYHSS